MQTRDKMHAGVLEKNKHCLSSEIYGNTRNFFRQILNLAAVPVRLTI